MLVKKLVRSFFRKSPVFCIPIGICLVASGCAPKQEGWAPVSNPAAEWDSHEKSLKAIDSWVVKGKVGVSDGIQAESVHFTWTQRGQHYEIDFYGPLGVKVATLIKQDSEVSLVTSSGKKEAKDPETLMVEELGFSMPVRGLSEWMMGLPQSTASPKTVNTFGYLSRLEEDGWEITYVSYDRKRGLGFPHQMILKRESVRVVLSLERP